ncbi:MAG: hypothetical protein C0606_03860 [Hyphomicrobiales bacterium]|nr:MAG: hypothetical protein C0606_03860 [Hyphomicrobiales bacterium]
MSIIADVADKFGGVAVAVLAIAWGASAPIGMIYWAIQGSLVGVVLSLIVPGYGVISTAFEFFT